MTNLAIQIEQLGKRYTRGKGQPAYGRLTESLSQTLTRKRDPYSERATSFWALRDISFEVTQGQIIGLIGANGAGKSTLLKILSRITPPTTGRAFLHGRVASLLEVGTGFHRELTGRENIYLNGAILGMRKGEIDEQFDAIVDFAEAGSYLDTPVKRYSSGMYVRLAFSVAAHLDADILLLDEVLSVGDAAFKEKSFDRMTSMIADGRTVVLVSHDLAAIRSLCSHAFWLQEGEVASQGDADEIIDSYLRGVVRSQET